MSLGEIFKTALTDTALGMGTVFLILIFISVCIWLMGILCRERRPAADAAAARAGGASADGEITPELIAVITAAIHQSIRDEGGADDGDEYIVRNVRRATWKHTS